MWRNTDDLLGEIQTVYEDLKAGEIDAMEARAHAALFKQATKLIELRLQHARITGRLGRMARTLPDFSLSPDTGRANGKDDVRDAYVVHETKALLPGR